MDIQRRPISSGYKSTQELAIYLFWNADSTEIGTTLIEILLERLACTRFIKYTATFSEFGIKVSTLKHSTNHNSTAKSILKRITS